MTGHDPLRVLGVDACRNGWVAVELTDGAFSAAYLAGTLAEICAAVPDAAAIGVDMPLGLLPRGWRRADDEARAALGPLRNSVFRVVPGPVWRETGYAAAVARCRELNGLGFSQQTWGLRDKLLEANVCRDAGRHPLHEVHPEVSFSMMPGDAPRSSKKSWTGQAERRGTLRRAGIELPDELGEAGRAAPDDVLDAAAAAWSAQRIARREAGCFPDPPQYDDGGRPIAIYY